MSFRSIKRATKAIVWIDIVINYTLGIWLLNFPVSFDHMIGAGPVLPIYFYRIIGFCMLLFGIWQSFMVARKKIISRQYLLIATVLAVIPILVLTAALLLLNLPVKPVWRTIIWSGDIYMVLLSAWYIRVYLMFASKK